MTKSLKLILLLCTSCPIAQRAAAYTAAGDRQFPATIVLPQIGPSDEAYLTAATLPQAGASPGQDGRNSSFAATVDKTVTERLSLTVTEEYSAVDPGFGSTATGWQNVTAALQYLAVLDKPHEFLLSFGVQQEFPRTGAARVGASSQGATTPAVFFGKGLGDLDIGFLRPLAVSGYVGYAAADRGPRLDQWVSGFSLEYSIPYLQSNVRSLSMPNFLRNLTPMVEVALTNSVGAGAGPSTAVVAPGFNYSGNGWDFGIEALVPASRAAGTGLGATAQFHFMLDYLFPRSVGKPLF